jgi:hypothetical protein
MFETAREVGVDETEAKGNSCETRMHAHLLKVQPPQPSAEAGLAATTAPDTPVRVSIRARMNVISL